MAAPLIHRQLVGAYVYAITVNGIVRYIGKGRRYRVLEHSRVARVINRRRANGERVKALPFHNKLAKAIRNGATISYKIIVQGLSDKDAYEREAAEIAAASPGALWNIKAGGEGGDGELMRRMWADLDYRARTLAGQEASRDEGFRQRQREAANAQWADADFRKRWLEQHRSLWDDPDKAEQRRSLLKKVWDDPGKTERKRALVKSQWTPERRAAHAENRRLAWANQEFKARASASIRASKQKTNAIRPEDGGSVRAAGAEEVQT